MTPETIKELRDEAAVKYPLDVLGVPVVRTYAKREGYVAGATSEAEKNESNAVLKSEVESLLQTILNCSNEVYVLGLKVTVVHVNDIKISFDEYFGKRIRTMGSGYYF